MGIGCGTILLEDFLVYVSVNLDVCAWVCASLFTWCVPTVTEKLLRNTMQPKWLLGIFFNVASYSHWNNDKPDRYYFIKYLFFILRTTVCGTIRIIFFKYFSSAIYITIDLKTAKNKPKFFMLTSILRCHWMCERKPEIRVCVCS